MAHEKQRKRSTWKSFVRKSAYIAAKHLQCSEKFLENGEKYSVCLLTEGGPSGTLGKQLKKTERPAKPPNIPFMTPHSRIIKSDTAGKPFAQA